MFAQQGRCRAVHIGVKDALRADHGHDLRELPATGVSIGVDRLRALQAPCHTHDTSGTVWLEGTGGKDVTLGQLFDLWGVRLTSTCLGATCGRVVVTVDGTPVASPRDVRLRDATSVRVEASPGS